MKLIALNDIFDIRKAFISHGHYKITVELFSGEKFTHVTTNMEIIDNWDDEKNAIAESILYDNGMKVT